MPITPTNVSKNTITPQPSTKSYAQQGVYGVGIYGVAIYGAGQANYGQVTNISKNTGTYTNQVKN